MISKRIYSIFDVEMNMWTDPFVLRNDVEAKKLFKSWIGKDFFNGCPVELYCLGEWSPGAEVPISFITKKRVYIDDTVDDVEEVDE